LFFPEKHPFVLSSTTTQFPGFWGVAQGITSKTRETLSLSALPARIAPGLALIAPRRMLAFPFFRAHRFSYHFSIFFPLWTPAVRLHLPLVLFENIFLSFARISIVFPNRFFFFFFFGGFFSAGELLRRLLFSSFLPRAKGVRPPHRPEIVEPSPSEDPLHDFLLFPGLAFSLPLKVACSSLPRPMLMIDCFSFIVL